MKAIHVSATVKMRLTANLIVPDTMTGEEILTMCKRHISDEEWIVSESDIKDISYRDILISDIFTKEAL